MDLDAYRRTAESFITELMREYYRHYAGLKDSFEIEAIYASHQGLFTRDAVHALRELDGRITEDSDARRRARMMLDFAVESYVGESTPSGLASPSCAAPTSPGSSVRPGSTGISRARG